MGLRPVGWTTGTLTRLVAATALSVVAASALGASAVAEHDRSNAHRPLPSVDAKTAPPTTKADKKTRARVKSRYGKLPLAFEANVGQVDRQVRYLAHGSGYTLFLTDTGAVLNLQQPTKVAARKASGRLVASAPRAKQAAVRFRAVGGSLHPQTGAADKLPGTANYFIGKKRSGWHTKVPTFTRVHTTAVWPGIDQTWYGKNNGLEYDLTLAPGVDAAIAQFDVDGAKALRLDAHKNLLIPVGKQTLTEHAPVADQDINGQRVPVVAGYRLLGAHRFGFTIGTHDAKYPVVIDPSIVYSTYLGGGVSEVGVDIAVDNTGAAYVTGATSSNNFPVCTVAGNPAGCTGPSYQINPGGQQDAFVTKLSPSGNQVLYSTYLGGSGDEDKDAFGAKGMSAAIAIDPTGNAYVTGSTQSLNFPTTPGAFQPTRQGTQDAFVTVLNPAGNGLVYSTYLGGGRGAQSAYGIAVAPNCTTGCEAYVTGATSASDFPLQNPIQGTIGTGNPDAFVAELKADGSGLVYSTYLGGDDEDEGTGIAVDNTGAAYLSGATRSSNLTTTANAFQPARAGTKTDAFVAKLAPLGASRAYATYLGGTGSDRAFDIALAPTCASACPAYVTGATQSTDFPTAGNPFQNHLPVGAGANAFVTEVNPGGTALVYSTYLGGTSGDEGFGIAVDRNGAAYVTGLAGSTNFPTANAFQAHLAGTSNAFVTALNPTGSGLLYSSYLGGNAIDLGYAIAVDPTGAAYLTGFTLSTTFPTANPFQAQPGNNTSNAFVTKISAPPASHGPGIKPPRSPHGHHHHCGNNDPNPNTNSTCR